MNKYVIRRDTRTDPTAAIRGKLSMCITAGSQEEARADFEARWQQKFAAGPEHLPVRTTQQIQASAMTPAALAVKRNTLGMVAK